MKIEMARYIPETLRQEMIAEALALAYDASTNLGKRAVIDAIATTMDLIGDPLEKIWIEDATGKRRTHKVEEVSAVFGERVNFRYLWAIPESERRNSKARWLTAATIDNSATHRATLFFALPRGQVKEFWPHLTLLRLLSQADLVPQYGFGYRREYGGPDYFAEGHANKSGLGPPEQPDRFRSARRLILDVFPLNVLSEVQLQQRLGGGSIKEWIFRTTGPESLQQIGPRCFVWSVPDTLTASLSAQLKELGSTQ